MANRNRSEQVHSNELDAKHSTATGEKTKLMMRYGRAREDTQKRNNAAQGIKMMIRLRPKHTQYSPAIVTSALIASILVVLSVQRMSYAQTSLSSTTPVHRTGELDCNYKTTLSLRSTTRLVVRLN